MQREAGASKAAFPSWSLGTSQTAVADTYSRGGGTRNGSGDTRNGASITCIRDSAKHSKPNDCYNFQKTNQQRNAEKNTMSGDYIPRSYANLQQWLHIQQTDIAEVGATLGMTDGEQASYLASVQRLLDTITTIVDLTHQLDQLKADLDAILAVEVPHLHLSVRRLKTHAGYTPSIGLRMGWVGGRHEIDPETSQPVITATVLGLRVRIEGTKPGFESINVYMRRKGEVTWVQIALRKRRYPVYDETPPLNPDISEVREYLCRGVVDDAETGLPSPVVEAVVAR